MSGQGWWYLTRASGLLAWALLGGSVLLGTMQSARRNRWRTATWYVDLHRGLSALACFAIAAHVVALLADDFAGFTLAEVTLPFQRDGDRWGVAWGVFTFYLVVVVEASSLASRRLSYRAWRRVHHLGLVVFWVATLHGVLVGTDGAHWLVRVVAVVLIAAVAATSAQRIVVGGRQADDGLRPDLV